MAADIPGTLSSWSTTAGSNQPDTTDAVGPNKLAENLQVIQAVVAGISSGAQPLSAPDINGGTVDAITSLSVAGNTTITGTGRRIKADFSNGTATNRCMVQTSTAAGTTYLGVIPGASSGVGSEFVCFRDEDTANTSFLRIAAGNSANYIESGAFGTGTQRDIYVYTNSALAAVLDTSQNTTLYGNLVLSASKFMQGDFSNATLSSRTILQSSTTNGNTVVPAIPNGTATTSGYRFHNASDLTNFAYGTTQITSTSVRLSSHVAGSGTLLPLEIVVGAVTAITVDTVGSVAVTNHVRTTAPVTKTGDFSVGEAENYLINNKAGSTCTVTLPAAASYTGREITIKTIQAQLVVSASSNVVPLAGGAAGTAILAATAGKWATLVSNGTNWEIMAAA